MYAELIGFIQVLMKRKKKKKEIRISSSSFLFKIEITHLYIYIEGMRVKSCRQKKTFHYIQLLLQ
jgi:hypothetical protein